MSVQIFNVKEECYLDFCNKLSPVLGTDPGLGRLYETSLQTLLTPSNHPALESLIYNLKINLKDESVGVAAVDIAKSKHLSEGENFVYGAALMTALFKGIAEPSFTGASGTAPFTLHKASHSDVSQMEQIGLERFTPDAKLGYHNDGTIRNGEVFIPHHIAVLNTFIGYDSPGYFHWVPTARWDGASKYHKEINSSEMCATVKLTPTMTKDGRGGFIHNGPSHISTLLFKKLSEGRYEYFLNGDVLSDDNGEEVVRAFHLLKESILTESRPISIRQQERRGIFINNLVGFHARDVFEDPVPHLDLSRVYLRFVDANAERYPSVNL